MDIDRMRKLAGLEPLNESSMTPEQELAALEKQFKDEVDPRARSAIKFKIDKLKGDK